MSLYIKLLTVTSIVTLSQSLFSLLLPFIVYEYTQSYGFMTVVKTIEYLPNITIVLLLGNLVDRYGWRTNMTISIFIQGIIISFVILTIFAHSRNYFYIFLELFTITSMSILFNNARVCAISNVTNTEHLSRANSFIQAILQTSQIIAPILLSIFVMFSNLYYGFIFCAISLLIALLFLMSTRTSKKNHLIVPESNRKTFKQTVVFLKKNKSLIKLSVIASIINSVEGTQIILYIFQTKSIYNLSNTNLGILFSTMSLIVIIFCFLIAKNKNLFFKKKIFIFLFGLNALLYLFCFLNCTVSLLSVCLVISNITFAITAIYIWTFRQLNTPPEILGRITSITSMIFKLGIPIMMLLTYLLTKYFNQEINYLLFSLLCVSIAIIIIFDRKNLII
jgi:MFS family permease